NPSLPGLKAVRQDGKTFARELWRVVVGGQEDQYQKRVTVVPAGTSLVYDLDNDGHYLVLASIRNEHGDGATHLVVLDARTGLPGWKRARRSPSTKRWATCPRRGIRPSGWSGTGRNSLRRLPGKRFIATCRLPRPLTWPPRRWSLIWPASAGSWSATRQATT